MSRDLLLEIGAEELPASFVTHALDVMKTTAEKLLGDARLPPTGSIRVLGTPRRLALVIPGIPDKQPDRRETVMGPPASAGLKPDGSFSPAAEGFAKKQGATTDAIRVVETPKGKYIAVEVAETGKSASEVLPELLATLCQRITFPKAMRWGEGEHAFGRPIHWIIALHGDTVVPFSFAGITSGRSTRGHRFLAARTFDVQSSADYVDKLREGHVLVDMDERRKTMHERLVAAAKNAGGELIEDEFLMGECLSLVEEPHVVPGTIEARFLSLPDDVIVSVMRTHQRYFAVRDASGKLSPTYLNVVNTALDPATIAKGNDRVLRARLKDAEFFVAEDRKVRLDSPERKNKLDRVVFQMKLGTVGQKIVRVDELARSLAPDADMHVSQAAFLAKADLTTYIVGEFPELQGIMGRYYARELGVPEPVADAIRDHYKPAGAEDSLPTTAVAAAVAVADRADSLVGIFGIGLVPSGSADPFALRRATLGILRIAISGVLEFDLRSLLAHAKQRYEAQGVDFGKHSEGLLGVLEDFFRGRIRAFYRDGYPGDVVDACLEAVPVGQLRSLRDLDARIKAVNAFRSAPEYGSLAVAFKRAWNIAKDVQPGAVDDARLEAGPEADLAAAFASARGKIDASVNARDYEGALREVAVSLRTPIDTYFEKVFVMVEDEALRANRLRLLRSIADTVQRIVCFHLLSA